MNIVTPDSLMVTAKILGIALGVFMGLCFLIGVLSGSTEIKPLKIPDKIDIGYISGPSNAYRYTTYDESDNLKAEQDEIKRLRNKVTKIKLERQLAEQLEIERLIAESNRQKQQENNSSPNHIAKQSQAQQKPEDKKHPLFDDCVAALMSLGEKKTSAMQATAKFLKDNPKTKTIDEFIVGVYKR
jgi:hypothetical protein